MNANEIVLSTMVAALAATVVALLFLRRRVPPRPERLERRAPIKEEILERMSEGVLVLDGKMSPMLANAAARSLLGLDQASFSGRMISEEVLAVGRKAAGERREATDVVQVWWPRRGHLSVRATPLTDDSVVVVIQDITEELRTQRMRREFVTHASHELKSPVAGLQALAEAVGQAMADDDHEAAKRFSERLVLETERLGRLVDDLLDLSRLEDPEGITKETIDLSRVALQEQRSLREPAESKGVGLTSAIAPGVMMEGDPQQISLMLRNLLDNAVRYTRPGGGVELEVRMDGSDALVRVSDSGIGIPLESQPRVFERFYRVDRARSRDKGGTGLGLAIVKHVVESHGGRIDLVSELERGSTFTVRLPASVTMRSAAG